MNAIIFSQQETAAWAAETVQSIIWNATVMGTALLVHRIISVRFYLLWTRLRISNKNHKNDTWITTLNVSKPMTATISVKFCSRITKINNRFDSKPNSMTFINESIWSNAVNCLLCRHNKNTIGIVDTGAVLTRKSKPTNLSRWCIDTNANYTSNKNTLRFYRK